ncbi:hypothetical protein DEN87_20760 [Escherichia coli]|nr:hypothetical protein DEN87_20760 [Escherichia coli]
MPKTPRVYVAFCFYICNLNAALAMLGKFLEFAGMLCNLHIKWLIFCTGLVGSERTFPSE